MSAGPTTDPHAAPANAIEGRIGDALDELRTFRAGLWAPVLLGFIMLFDSWDSIAIAYVMPSLTKEWGLSPAVAGMLISSGYVGQFIGAVLLGGLAERFGRLPVFVVAVVVMGALALACAFSPNYEVLLAVRFVQGIAIGGALPVSITYVNELAPTQTRGRYFTIFQWLCMSGYAVAAWSSTIVIPLLGWRWLFGLGAIPLVLLPLVVLTLPESPRWLARVGRSKDAEKALTKLGANLAQLPPGPDLAPAPPVAVAPRIKPAVLFSGHYRRRTLTIILLWFLISFTNFGLTTWAPTIFTTVYKIPLTQALAYAATAGTLFLVTTPIVGALMDRLGRRPFAIFGTGVASLALATLSFVTLSGIWQVVVLVITAKVCMSIGSFILWPYTAESYPTEVRAVGLGVCSSTARGASMLTPLFVGWILSSGGSITIVFGVFSLLAGAAALLWLLGTRETARVRLETL